MACSVCCAALLKRLLQKWGDLSENRMAFMLLLVLVSALCTERLGIHLLFGAFLMGAIMPKEPKFVALRARPL